MLVNPRPSLRCLLTAVLPAGLWLGCAGPAEPPPGRFTIATYNVNLRMPGAAETVSAIEAADADIVCLQETTPEWARLLRERLGGRYPHMAFRHAPADSGGGQAVLSRLPFREVARHQPKGAWFPGWLLVVEGPAGPVQVLNVHLTPPVDEAGELSLRMYWATRELRRDEMASLYGLLDRRAPTVVLGDFNELSAGPAVGFLRRRGFTSALGRHDAFSDTWRASDGPLSPSARIDHIFHSPELRCLSARVLREGGSDHWPVVAELAPAADGP